MEAISMVPLQGLCAHQAHGFFLRSIQVLFTNGITELCPSVKLNRTHGWENKTFAVNGHVPPQWTRCIHLVGLLGCVCLSHGPLPAELWEIGANLLREQDKFVVWARTHHSLYILSLHIRVTYDLLNPSECAVTLESFYVQSETKST